MGLLSRSRSTQTVKETKNTIPVDALVQSISQYSTYIDYPEKVFNAFKRFIGFTKGALFFPEENIGEYYPWIVDGLDRTTARRLRIPMDSEQLCNNDPQKRGTLIDPDFLKPMISKRDLAFFKNPFILCLTVENNIEAIILATENTTLINQETIDGIRVLNRDLTPGIMSSRSILNPIGLENESMVDEWLETWGTKSAIIALIDSTVAIDSIMQAIVGLELYRARKDIAILLHHIIGGMGHVYDLKDGRLLALVPSEHLPDQGLFLHQLSQAFSSVYGNLNDIPNFPTVFLNWPTEKDQLMEALTGMD